MTRDALTLYADYACPFCYLGHASLETYREQRSDPLPVEWHPFDLLASQRNEDGTIVRESHRDDEYFEQAWRNVERLADDYGVEVPDAPITDTDSLPAQQLSLYVQAEYPQQWAALDDALYRAVWREERDVSDETVLRDVARSVDLDSEVVDAALADDELRAQLTSRFEQARQQGITGVPTFVYEGRALQGSIPPNQLRQLVEGY